MLPENHASGAATISAGQAPGARAGSPALRLAWMLGGPLLMIVSLGVIAGKPALSPGLSDAVFWAAVLLTGFLRALDVTRYHGETTRGLPATTRDLKRYLLGLGATSVACWIAAQAIHV